MLTCSIHIVYTTCILVRAGVGREGRGHAVRLPDVHLGAAGAVLAGGRIGGGVPVQEVRLRKSFVVCSIV